MPRESINQRKQDHLSIVQTEDSTFEGSNLLECVQLEHCSLPELDLNQLDLGIEFFGKQLKAPLMITSMTGGAARSAEMNRNLSRVAARYGIAFAVGSQRVMVEKPDTREDFAVRGLIPDGVLLGNIGAQQLVEYTPEQIRGLVDGIEADGLCIHLNPAHEMAQGGGERCFSGHLAAIGRAVEILDGRVLVKETGNGLAPKLARQLTKIGVRYIDVAGAGGTSWTKVERHRKSKFTDKAIAWVFGEWGLPTAYCTIGARRLCGDQAMIVASGGLQTGLDVARAIAAGADIAGMARVALRFAELDNQGRSQGLEEVIHELKTAMLLTGCPNLAALRNVTRMYTGQLNQWLAAQGWLDPNRSINE